MKLALLNFVVAMNSPIVELSDLQFLCPSFIQCFSCSNVGKSFTLVNIRLYVLLGDLKKSRGILN